jgi:hypothetical protein
MRQAIQTKFLGPTNTRGSRVKAYCQAGAVTIHWGYADSDSENHIEAVRTLIKKLEWDENGWMYGWSADGRGIVAVHTI